jgi:hypothetical protein
MGEPVSMSPDTRAKLRALAASIVASVIEDEHMPLGFDSETFGKCEVYLRDDVESLVCQLAQEVVALTKERDGLRVRLLEACDLFDFKEEVRVPPFTGIARSQRMRVKELRAIAESHHPTNEGK